VRFSFILSILNYQWVINLGIPDFFFLFSVMSEYQITLFECFKSSWPINYMQ